MAGGGRAASPQHNLSQLIRAHLLTASQGYRRGEPIAIQDETDDKSFVHN